MWTALLIAIALASEGFGENLVGLAIGGYGSSNSIELITKDGICRTPEMNPSMPVAPAGSPTWVAEWVGGRIHLCGGQALQQKKECYSYDPNAPSSFHKLCPMLESRKYPSSITHNDEFVVMGGYNDGSGWLDSVEIVPSGQCEFQFKPEWTLPRKMYNFCSVNHEGKIYVIGGSVYAFLSNSDIADVSILDTSNNEWTKAEPLPRSRSSAGCAIFELDGEMGILVAGGCDESCHTHLYDTLFYSFGTGEWTTLSATLHIPRMGMKMLVIGGKPTVIGGYNDRILDSVEEFEDGQWHSRADKLYAARYQYGMPSALPEGIFSCPLEVQESPGSV